MLKKLAPYATLSMSIISLAVFLYLIVDLSNTIEELAISSITKKNKVVHENIEGFFNPLEKEIDMIIDMGKAGLYDNINLKEFDMYFIPVLSNTSQFSSLMLANSDGDEKMLLELEDSWINRETFNGSNVEKPEMVEWSVNDGEINIIRKWQEASDYNPLNRPWYEAAFINDDEINWTDPYIFHTTKDLGITASKKWTNTDGKEMVFGFDILLNDLSNFMRNLSNTKNGLAFVITEDNRMLGLKKNSPFLDSNSYKLELLKPLLDYGVPELVLCHDKWMKSGGGDKLFSYNVDGVKWWGSIVEFKLGDKLFRSGVIAPERDFSQRIEKFRLVLLGSLTLILFFTFSITMAHRKIRKTNFQLAFKSKEHINQRDIAIDLKNKSEIQKQLLEEKNNEITASLNYATRIQNAILPPLDEFYKFLKDGFIFYRPKDIVAGDFYWLLDLIRRDDLTSKEETTHVLFAVADCTGHGVPGALVSVICSNALYRSVLQYRLIDPGEILDKTLEIILDEFGKSDTQIKDGMDIALCALEEYKEKHTLKYAGANNPIYIIRSSKHERLENPSSEILEYKYENYNLYKIKANRQPIGEFISYKPFRTVSVDLLKGDVLYLFSDGYSDQFGGENEKKFKVKSFRDLLIMIQNKDMPEQKSIIESTFKNWKGNNEQIDDVCVLGIKIS